MTFQRFVLENRSFLAAGFLLALSSSYGQTFFISIFAGEIMGTFALSDGQWGGIYTVGTTLSALVMLWAGTLTDRFRVRQLAAGVLILLAVACIFMSVVPVWWMLIPAVFFLRLMGQGMLSHLAVVSMARWFVAARGRALAISSMGFALGQAALPLVFVALLTWLDWRWLWIISAIIVLATLPVLYRLLALERTPQSMASQDQATGLNNRHWTRGEVLKHPLFWFILPAMIGPPAWGTALFFQQVHLTEVKGWSLVSFVSLLPLYTAVGIAATFAVGWAIDRFGTARLMPFYAFPYALAFLVMAYAVSIPHAAIAMALFGITQGLQSTIPGAFWAEFFGTRHLGSIKAVATAIMVFGSAIGPGITGLFIDFGIDFPTQMIAIVGYFVVAGIMAAIGVISARRQLPAF